MAAQLRSRLCAIGGLSSTRPADAPLAGGRPSGAMAAAAPLAAHLRADGGSSRAAGSRRPLFLRRCVRAGTALTRCLDHTRFSECKHASQRSLAAAAPGSFSRQPLAASKQLHSRQTEGNTGTGPGFSQETHRAISKAFAETTASDLPR